VAMVVLGGEDCRCVMMRRVFGKMRRHAAGGRLMTETCQACETGLEGGPMKDLAR
jgi:hypothetical protein